MALSPSSPLTGAAITGLTNPTYTLTVDTPPDINAKQWAVTALGGTQTDVVAHSPDRPFTVTVKRPKVLKLQGSPNPITGVVPKSGMNEYAIIIRKGVSTDLNGAAAVAVADVRVRIPVGSTVNDSKNLLALFSALGGFIANQVQGLSDTTSTGIL
jgi:hypothetical protein